MKLTQVSYIHRELRFLDMTFDFKNLLETDFPYVQQFYSEHINEEPTEAECKQGLDFLDANNANVDTMIIFRKSYPADIPELEKEYPRVQKYYARLKQNEDEIPLPINESNYSDISNEISHEFRHI